ncbi:hypothetical protein G6F59_014299 [Rhizopus arrhizus]|nr:hypothetical protein G6F59_014299 [Rhizopus arrhizus]
MPELIGRVPTVYVLCAAALAIIYLLPRITRAVPSPLVAIVVLTAVVIGFGPAALPASGCSAYLGNVAHPAAGISHAGGGRPARIDDDPADRRRHHRNAQRAQPRMRRPGRGQHGHRLPRRHGRLRDDRPVGHQRDLRRPRAPVLPGGRRGVAGAGGVRQRAGAADPDGRAGGGDDHGQHRHLQLALAARPAHASAQFLRCHAADRGGHRGHPRPGKGGAQRRAAVGAVLRPQGGPHAGRAA